MNKVIFTLALFMSLASALAVDPRVGGVPVVPRADFNAYTNSVVSGGGQTNITDSATNSLAKGIISANGITVTNGLYLPGLTPGSYARIDSAGYLTNSIRLTSVGSSNISVMGTLVSDSITTTNNIAGGSGTLTNSLNLINVSASRLLGSDASKNVTNTGIVISGGTNYGFNGQHFWNTGLGAFNQLAGPSDQLFSIVSTIPVQTASAVAGNGINITASNATAGNVNAGSAAGGSVNIAAGDEAQLTGGASSGGSIALKSGNSQPGGTAGNIALQTGIGGGVSANTITLTGGTAAATGGSIAITGGNGVSGSGSSVTLTAGGNSSNSGSVLTLNAGSTSASGSLSLQGGTGTVSGSSSGGITVSTASPASSSTSGATTGSIAVNTGNGGAVSAASGTANNGGAQTFTLGSGGAESGNTSGIGGNGGACTVTGGAGGNATGAGGTHLGGNGTTITLTSGAGGSATGASGTRTGGNSGNIILATGASGTGATANGTVGSIVLSPGGTAMLTISATLGLQIPTTITTPGTTGNQTINKLAGRVNIAASGTTVTVTDSFVTANSIIVAVAATADATARVTNVVPAAGSFVINTVACTLETAFAFEIKN